MRREGAPSGDDRPGRRQVDPDRRQEHLQSGRARHADLRDARGDRPAKRHRSMDGLDAAHAAGMRRGRPAARSRSGCPARSRRAASTWCWVRMPAPSCRRLFRGASGRRRGGAGRGAAQEFCFELERGFADARRNPRPGDHHRRRRGGRQSRRHGRRQVFGALGPPQHHRQRLRAGDVRPAASRASWTRRSSRARSTGHSRGIVRDGRSRWRSRCSGVGKVGGALLRELGERQASWRERGIDVKVIADRQQQTAVVLDPRGIDLRTVARGAPARRSAGRSARTRRRGGRARPAECRAHRLHRRDGGRRRVRGVRRGEAATSSRRTSARACCRGTATRPCGRLLAARRRRFLDPTTVGAGLPLHRDRPRI